MGDEKENKDKIDWLDKLLFRLMPKLAMRRFAKKIGIAAPKFEVWQDIFSQTKRIDIFPAGKNSRGFVLIIDGQTALFFYQNGDHFEYDGFEMGKYNQGDVTVFDNADKNFDLYPN